MYLLSKSVKVSVVLNWNKDRNRYEDMRRWKKYKKGISFFLAFFMIVTGIFLYSRQEDSCFLCIQTEESQTIDDIANRFPQISYLQYSCMYHLQISYESMKQYRDHSSDYKYGKMQGKNWRSSLAAWQQAESAAKMHQTEIRLCQPDKMSSAVVIGYIHHKDGLKDATLFF